MGVEQYHEPAMNLEFQLRHKSKWREIAKGILFSAGDIVQRAEKAEEKEA